MLFAVPCNFHFHKISRQNRVSKPNYRICHHNRPSTASLALLPIQSGNKPANRYRLETVQTIATPICGFDLRRLKKNHLPNNWAPFVRTRPPGNASTFSAAGTFQSPAPNKGCQVAEDDGLPLWGAGRSNYVTTCNGNACAVGMKACARFECDVGKWKLATYPLSLPTGQSGCGFVLVFELPSWQRIGSVSFWFISLNYFVPFSRWPRSNCINGTFPRRSPRFKIQGRIPGWFVGDLGASRLSSPSLYFPEVL